MAISHEAANQLGTDLVRVMKLFHAMRQHAPRLHPAVDATAYPVLFTLESGPKRVSTLAECVHSDVSTVSRQASMLAQHDLVEKLPDPDDRRAAMLSLTPAGKALIERLRTQRGEWFRSMLQDWSETEAEQFAAQLDRFAGALESSRDQMIKHFADAMSGVHTTASKEQ